MNLDGYTAAWAAANGHHLPGGLFYRDTVDIDDYAETLSYDPRVETDPRYTPRYSLAELFGEVTVDNICLLAHLTKIERRLVALYFEEGLSQEETGLALGMRQGTVSKRLSAILKKMRQAFN